MRGSEHHSYLPLTRYVCTLTCQCFMHYNSTSESIQTIMKPYKHSAMAGFEAFTLTKESKDFIIEHTCITHQIFSVLTHCVTEGVHYTPSVLNTP